MGLGAMGGHFGGNRGGASGFAAIGDRFRGNRGGASGFAEVEDPFRGDRGGASGLAAGGDHFRDNGKNAQSFAAEGEHFRGNWGNARACAAEGRHFMGSGENARACAAEGRHFRGSGGNARACAAEGMHFMGSGENALGFALGAPAASLDWRRGEGPELRVTGVDGALMDQLVEAATALHHNELGEFRERFRILSQYANPDGSRTARFLYHMLQGLLLRFTGMGFHAFSTPSRHPSQSIDKAFLTMAKEVPCMRRCHLAIQSSVCKLLDGEQHVHVIEFGGFMMAKWPSVFRTLSQQYMQLKTQGPEAPPSSFPPSSSPPSPPPPSSPPSSFPPSSSPSSAVPPIQFRLTLVSLTCVISPERSDIKGPSTKEQVCPWLIKAAADVGILLEVEQVVLHGDNLHDLDAKLTRRPNEALVVISFLIFDFLVDNSVVDGGIRETILKSVCHMEPRSLLLVSMEVQAASEPFLERFCNLMKYTYTSLGTYDAVAPLQGFRELMLVFEQTFVVRSLYNQIACEGPERVVRTFSQEHWWRLMSSVGLVPEPIVGVSSLYEGLSTSPDGFGFRVERGCASMTYHGMPSLTLSAWISAS